MRLYIDENGANTHGFGVVGRVFETVRAHYIEDGDVIMTTKNIDYNTPTSVKVIKRTDKTVTVEWQAAPGVPATKNLHVNDVILREVGDRLGFGWVNGV